MSDDPLDPTEEWSLEEVVLVRLRPDGSAITVDEVADYFERLAVPAHVLDGEVAGNDGFIHFMVVCGPGAEIVRAAADQVNRDDGAPTALNLPDLVASTVQHFDTFAWVEHHMLLVDPEGTAHYADDLPAGYEGHAAALPELFGPPVVHVISSKDPLNHGVAAQAAESPVEVVIVDGVSIIYDASGRSGSTVAELALKSECPVLSINETNGVVRIDGAVRVRRKKAGFVVFSGTQRGFTVGVDDDPVLREFLVSEAEVYSTSETLLPAELLGELEAAARDPENVIERVLVALDLPAAADAWLKDGAPPAQAKTVEFNGVLRLWAAAALDPDAIEEFESTPVYGRLWRLFRKRPWSGLLFGTFELAVAVVLMTIARDWGIVTWVRWIVAVVWFLDGTMNTLIAVTRLRQCARAGRGLADPGS